MWSIRKSLAIGIAGAAIFLTACQEQQRVPGPEPLAATNVAPDPAMQVRNWDPSVATYNSDLVMAWPNAQPWVSESLPGLENGGTEVFLFLGNLGYSAVQFVTVNPPAWEKLPYKSLSMPPSYTAMPPLPPPATPGTMQQGQ
jgi:hypothetical protein